MKSILRLSAISLLTLSCGPGFSQGTFPTPEFDRLIHRGHQAEAWASLSSSGLADSALQTVEAERVLDRPEPNLPAIRVFQLALRLAVEKQDIATIDRLAEGAKRANRKDLFAEVNVARKTAGLSRTLSEKTLVSIEQIDAGQLTVHNAFLHDIQSAQLSGDARLLDNVLQDLDQLQEFPQPLRDSLKSAAIEARDSIEETPDVPAALNRLVAESRGYRWQWQGVKSGMRATQDDNVSHLAVEPPPSQPAPQRRPASGPALGNQRAGQSTNGQMSYETRQAALRLLRNPNSIKPTFARPSNRQGKQQ